MNNIKIFSLVILAVPVLSAQQSHSWTGLLVASGCQMTDSAGQKGTSVTDAVSDPLDRTTTPPVDDKGTRGKAGAVRPDIAGRKDGGPTRPGPDVSKLGSSCRIGEHTNAFALMLNDGKLVRFDEAGNSKIAHQLQSGDRLKHKTKIFRANVKGELQDDMISIDSIEI